MSERAAIGKIHTRGTLQIGVISEWIKVIAEFDKKITLFSATGDPC